MRETGRGQCVANFISSLQSPHPFFLDAEFTFILFARPLKPIPTGLRSELTNEDVSVFLMIGDENAFFHNLNSRNDSDFPVECDVIIIAGASLL